MAAIVGMRNRLVHDYAGIDLERVWETVRRDIPRLIPLLEPLVPPSRGVCASNSCAGRRARVSPKVYSRCRAGCSAVAHLAHPPALSGSVPFCMVSHPLHGEACIMALEKLVPWAHFAYIAVVALGAIGLQQLTLMVNANKDRELAKYQAEAGAEIEQAKGKAAEADARAAEANALAEQARLELAKLKQPRTISLAHQARMVHGLKKYAGQSYSFIAYEDSESHALLEQIDGILRQAGWSRIRSLVGAIVRDIAGDTVGGSANSGVAAYMGPNYPEGRNALLSLSNLLSDAGIPCQPNRDTTWGGKERETIIIEIGKKPVD